MTMLNDDKQPSKCGRQSQSSKTCVYSFKFGEEIMAFLKDLNRTIKKDCDIACKRNVNTDFFSK